jgi:hypothetical protein
MRKIIFTCLLLAAVFFIPRTAVAWSAKGHHLVAEIAFHFLDDSTKEKVQKYLGKLSIEEAATWMDDMRSNDYYSYMRSWHYIDIEKGGAYHPSAEDRNILIILNSAIEELKTKEEHKFKALRIDMYLLFHLIGDLHQPLHTGYPEDKGGNTIIAGYLHKNNSLNLHSIWDDAIIATKNISLQDCLNQYISYSAEEIASIQKLDVLDWFRDSRSLLDTVYDFKNNLIDDNYVNNNAIVIEKQLLKAGLRLAAVLKEVFRS